MTQIYARMLEEGFIETNEFLESQQSRLTYLSEYIFDFTTYDGGVAELFATKALEVCAAISDGKTFDYIKDPDNYQWYLLMCNMPFFAERLSWGGSIRGAWWDNSITLDSCGLFLDGGQIVDTMEFTRDEWAEFIAAVLAFATAKGET